MKLNPRRFCERGATFLLSLYRRTYNRPRVVHGMHCSRKVIYLQQSPFTTVFLQCPLCNVFPLIELISFSRSFIHHEQLLMM